ncbi:MAG: excisionase [Sedimenticola sp.]
MLISLSKWGERNFDPPPSKHILRNWIRHGLIRPIPVKVGNVWYCQENAQYISREQKEVLHDDPVVMEIWNNG